MLKSLEIILDKPENEHFHEHDFETAAAYILQKQFIWSDGFGQKKHYDLTHRFFDYFDTLFDAVGFTLVRDYKYGYLGIVPRYGIPLMHKLDTLLLLLLVKMHDEQSRRACTERGRSTPCLGVLLDLYEQSTGLEKPSRADFLASLKRLARHGVILIGDIDEQTHLPKLTVTPAITHLVTTEFLASIESFLHAREGILDDELSIEAETTKIDRAQPFRASD